MAYKPGDIVIAPFSYTDLTESKYRPVLLIAMLPQFNGDWLGCMITSQMHQFSEGLDIKISETDSDFILSSLKAQSLIRVTRLMVISEEVMTGRIGSITK